MSIVGKICDNCAHSLPRKKQTTQNHSKDQIWINKTQWPYQNLSPEKQLWISPAGKSSCLLQWSGTSYQSRSLCIFQIGCCCHFEWFLHSLWPLKKCIFLDANLFRAIHCFESNSCFDKRCTSVIGLDANTLSSTRVLLPDLLTTAKYLIAYRADTVLPAPDSPLTMIDWFLWFLEEKMNFRTSITLSFYVIVWGFYCLAICLYASSATENIWGSMSPMFWPE